MGHEFHAFIASDGLSLYFSSDRPGGRITYDLWVSERASINNLAASCRGMLVLQGSGLNAGFIPFTFLIKRTRQAAGYETRERINAPWGDPIPLPGEVNSHRSETAPFVSDDELTLYFSDYRMGLPRRGGLGLADLWMASRESHVSPWGEPINLGRVVNSDRLDTLFVTSCRPEGHGGVAGWDIWLIRVLSPEAFR